MTQLSIIDAHHHLWDLSGGRHPWLCTEPLIPFRYGDYSDIRHNYLAHDLRRDAASYHLEKTVYVETEWDPRDPIGEVRWVERVAQHDELPDAVVAQAWLDREEIGDVLEAYDAFDIVRGVRHKPVAASAPEAVPRHSVPGSMRCERWRRGYAMLETHGLSFDLQTPWWHLHEALDLARTFPRTQIILNHAGLPADRSNSALAQWRDAMQMLADAPNVAVKISGLGQPGQAWTVAANREIVLDVIRIFGAERCMFASNFPVDSLVASYQTIFDGFDEITQPFADSDRRALFCENARRFYRLTQ